MVLFLCFLYHPEDVLPANVAKLGAGLPGMARLTHMYDAQQLLGCIEDWLTAPGAQLPRVGGRLLARLGACSARTVPRPT